MKIFMSRLPSLSWGGGLSLSFAQQLVTIRKYDICYLFSYPTLFSALLRTGPLKGIVQRGSNQQYYCSYVWPLVMRSKIWRLSSFKLQKNSFSDLSQKMVADSYHGVPAANTDSGKPKSSDRGHRLAVLNSARLMDMDNPDHRVLSYSLFRDIKGEFHWNLKKGISSIQF